MAKSGSDTLTCKDAELADRVDEYVEPDGPYESRNQALKDVIRVGLRESQSPILTRIREQAINYANMLCLFALVFLAGGIVTEPIEFANALLMAVVLVGAAVLMVGIVEAARLLRGANELGSAVHGWFA